MAHAPLDRQVDALERMLRSGPVVCRLLDRLPQLNLPNWYLGAGAVAQTVWNHLHGLPPTHEVKDYDVVYFDPDDLTRAGELAAQSRVAELLPDVAADCDVTNEARVHLWYQQRFGRPIDPYRSTEHAITTWPTTASSVGVHRDGRTFKVCAPFGLDDLFGMIVRANTTLVTAEVYEAKARRWGQLWPRLTILPWPQPGERGNR